MVESWRPSNTCTSILNTNLQIQISKFQSQLNMTFWPNCKTYFWTSLKIIHWLTVKLTVRFIHTVIKHSHHYVACLLYDKIPSVVNRDFKWYALWLLWVMCLQAVSAHPVYKHKLYHILPREDNLSLSTTPPTSFSISFHKLSFCLFLLVLLL